MGLSALTAVFLRRRRRRHHGAPNTHEGNFNDAPETLGHPYRTNRGVKAYAHNGHPGETWYEVPGNERVSEMWGGQASGPSLGTGPRELP
jgi:hypothetical protein